MNQSNIHERGMLSRWDFAYTESERRMDFNYKYTLPTKGIIPTSDNAADYDGRGGFMIFGSSKTAYNLNDAGQFLWGHAMNRLGFGYSNAKFGSEANEFFGDATGDQRAIRVGFHYSTGTQKAYPGVFKGLPLNSWGRRARSDRRD
jgi:hypothetical protein